MLEEPLSSVPAASPVVKPLPSVVQVVASEEVLLSCEASGIPQPMVIWQKEGLSIPEGKTSRWPAERARCPPPCPGDPILTLSLRHSPTFRLSSSFLRSFRGTQWHLGKSGSVLSVPSLCDTRKSN